MSELREGMRIRNKRTGRIAVVLNPYERCAYTLTTLARIVYEAPGLPQATIVNPGWMPHDWEKAS